MAWIHPLLFSFSFVSLFLQANKQENKQTKRDNRALWFQFKSQQSVLLSLSLFVFDLIEWKIPSDTKNGNDGKGGLVINIGLNVLTLVSCFRKIHFKIWAKNTKMSKWKRICCCSTLIIILDPHRFSASSSLPQFLLSRKNTTTMMTTMIMILYAKIINS